MKPRSRSAWIHARRRVRGLFTRPLAALTAALAPPFYMLYMRLVWSTSRVDLGNFGELQKLCDAHDGAVALACRIADYDSKRAQRLTSEALLIAAERLISPGPDAGGECTRGVRELY
jgi:hypothetical protein